MKKYYQKLRLLPALLLMAGSILAQTKELSLKRALEIASKGNRQLQMKWMENQQAAEAVKEAKSFLLPTVTVNGTYNMYAETPVIYLRNETASPKVNDVKYGGHFAFDGNIQVSYPIFDPVTRGAIKIAAISDQVSKQETKNTEELLALSISQLYITVLMYKEQLQLLKQSLQRNELALKDSRSLFLQGKNLKTDTLSNYIAVQNLEAAVSASENNIHVLSVQLKQLMGMDDSVDFIFTDSLVTHMEENIFHTGSELSVAMDNRKDVRIQSLLLDQTKAQLQHTKAAFKPQLSAIAQYQVQTQADDLKFWNYGFPRTSFAGLKLSIPVFSGNRLKYKSAQSELSIKQHELAMSELKSSIQTELITLASRMQEAHHQWQIKQQGADAAQVNYTMMNDRYRYGLSNRLELTDAELALTKSKLDQLQAVYSIRLIELQTRKAMGILQLN